MQRLNDGGEEVGDLVSRAELVLLWQHGQLLHHQLEVVGGDSGVLDLVEVPAQILPQCGVVVSVLGVGPRQLEVDVRAGDGVPSQGDDHLDLVKTNLSELG